jgi:hypothetical protein
LLTFAKVDVFVAVVLGGMNDGDFDDGNHVTEEDDEEDVERDVEDSFFFEIFKMASGNLPFSRIVEVVAATDFFRDLDLFLLATATHDGFSVVILTEDDDRVEDKDDDNGSLANTSIDSGFFFSSWRGSCFKA